MEPDEYEENGESQDARRHEEDIKHHPHGSTAKREERDRDEEG